MHFIPFINVSGVIYLHKKEMKERQDIPVYSIDGLMRRLPAVSKEEDSNFLVFDINTIPAVFREPNPFRNGFYVVGFIFEGSLRLKVDFNTFHITSNTVFFGTPGQVVSSTYNVEQGMGILFKKEFLMRQGSLAWLRSLPVFHRFHSAPVLHISNLQSSRIVTFLESMLEEYNHERPFKYDTIKSYLYLTLVSLSRKYTETEGPSEHEDNHYVHRFESLIDQHYKEIRSVKDYAEMMFTTPQNLNRVIKSTTGKTASDLINERLLIEIKRNLIFTTKSSEEIAYELNFHDNSYFIKYFKKSMGITPKGYRQMKGKE